jgi:hypothetical protein
LRAAAKAKAGGAAAAPTHIFLADRAARDCGAAHARIAAAMWRRIWRRRAVTGARVTPAGVDSRAQYGGEVAMSGARSTRGFDL